MTRHEAQAEIEERDAAAAAKELETVRLRAMQQKATDHKSELDELRARRRASVFVYCGLSGQPACEHRFSALTGKDLQVAKPTSAWTLLDA